MGSRREYPERPVIGVGGVVIEAGRALLIRRGSEPLKGEWSIPGGMLEAGETIAEGVVRELKEETGLRVGVLELIEVFERIFNDPPVTSLNQSAAALVPSPAREAEAASARPRPKYHFVILDYLCERLEGEACPGGDVTDVAWAREDELTRYNLSVAATRVIKKAFAMVRQQAARTTL